MADGSRTIDYEFDLPEHLIAQAPAGIRDESRLMIVHRDTAEIDEAIFRDLASVIPAGDALALNTTRVFRARLLGTRDSGAPAELLLLRPLGDNLYEAMVHPGGKLRPGRRVHVSPDFEAEILESTEMRTRIVRLRSTLPIEAAIERYGHVPLPPYIRRGDEADDSERYQTVYAEESGSVAAPTAGLHFTPELLSALEAKGVRRANLM
ncbi:MAG: S-adenosylmethionine:tRNA ribosyltransferase-isomerase, partial [Gemmatimonadota bacterium]|nr:S-adenosylmethionine:tRNA ribosyltransferase-isomerase [Gemmatimonadota bacterium]